MTKEELVDHLTTNGCIVVREDSRGYAVVRNVINGNMSGVPAATNVNGQLRPATVCRTCRTLGVEIPPEAMQAADIVDYIHKNTDKFTKPED